MTFCGDLPFVPSGIHHHLFENLRRKGHHCHGLTNAVPRDEIEQLLAAGPFYDLPDKLIHAANENGGPDNITALLLSADPTEVRNG